MNYQTFLRAALVFPLLVAASLPVQSALVAFTDRAVWRSAAGGTGDLFEDFNSHIEDEFYDPGPLAVGFLMFSVVDGVSDSSWRVDALPSFASSVPDVNGTTYVTALAQENSGFAFGNAFMSFAPMRALGFDYSGADYSTTDGVLTTSTGDVVVITEINGGETAFIGFLYTAGETFTSIEWEAGALKPGQGFRDFAMGIDNVEGFSPVPIPAAIWLLGPALGCLSTRHRRTE